ncbi:TIGR03089 family protein [Nocardioides sp.]|uniref:TIGR03089 family protein n=1 Tax=Nocardioides sp. TaxID=35761 RepID=UPI002736922A|nr:TIGR03089 family protein [Nocardioides sp.]MDP3894482.1 TIGR03089 family protein [Nocardioides sp.]
MTTFAAALADRLAHDPGQPLITFYDEATGERVELSVTTYANWVAKTASLLVEELDLERGDTLLVDLPTHWLGPVFLGAAWTAGLVVRLPGEDDVATLGGVVCGPASLEDHAGLAQRMPVLATALRPLGARFVEPLPAGVHDFGTEVWSQPDAFVPFDPPEQDDEALRGRSQGELLREAAADPRVADGARLLSVDNATTEAGLHTFLTPLTRRGSSVWVVGADAARLASIARSEQATLAR